jgi:rubredoxin
MPARPDIARNVETGMNGVVEYQPNPLNQFAPKYKVYIFNIGPMKHEVPKGSWGTFKIPACEPGQRYSRPLILPSIFRSSYMDAASLAMKTDDIEGKHVAQDIVNPFLGGDWSEGQDLTEKGVFWTMNETPTEEELATARTKMEAYGRKQLTIATELETKGQLGAITPTMRLFATYFGEDRSWNKIYRKIGECPMCGEPAKEGIVRHTCGYIFDPQKAYEADFIDAEKRDELLMRRGQAPKSKK